MTDKSRRERNVERKARDKALLEKYKGEAPRGPGLSWRLKLIFGVVGILLIILFMNIKNLYIGNTPIKVLDYSLTRSLSTDGRDIDIDIKATYHDKEDYELNTNIQYTFEFIKARIDTATSSIYIDTDSLAVKENDWVKYDFDQLIINDHEPMSWKPLEQVLDARSIPAINDTLEEYAQFFTAQYYNRFSFGEETEIKTKDDTYKARRIDVTLTEEDLYPLLKNFITFNDNIIDFREGVKDRIKRYLEAVQENELYDIAGLTEEEVTDYLGNFDENAEVTYILFITELNDYLDAHKETLDNLDIELTISFFVDNNEKVRAISANWNNLNESESLDQLEINYVVNNFKHGYIENPVEFEEAPDREPVMIESVLGDDHPVTFILNEIYRNFIN